MTRASSAGRSVVTKFEQYTAENSGEAAEATGCVEAMDCDCGLFCVQALAAASNMPRPIPAAIARIRTLLRLTPKRAVRGLSSLKLTRPLGRVNKMGRATLHFS